MSKNNEARVKFFCWWSCFTNSKRKGVGKGSNFYSEVWVKFLDTPTRFNPYVCGYLRQQQQYERNISWTSKVPIPILELAFVKVAMVHVLFFASTKKTEKRRNTLVSNRLGFCRSRFTTKKSKWLLLLLLP